ncbi:MAG: hypothetical protein ACO1NZ_07215 [Adhaeribacter sp.]
MEHKYNQLSIERYSTNLAKDLCDRYFATDQEINGQQLITFTPVRQINLFVIQELLLRWNQEMAHLKSPYFDFDHPEVKEALVQFMNILSRKILVRRPEFEPLLRKAIADTLLWALDPAQVFEEKFLKVQDEISGQKLLGHLKYLDLHKEYVKNFLTGLAPGNLPHGNVLNQFKTYLLRNKPAEQGPEQLISALNELLPLEQGGLQGHTAPAFTPQPAAHDWAEPLEEQQAPQQPTPASTPAPIPAPTPAPAPQPQASFGPGVVAAPGESLATAEPPLPEPEPVRIPVVERTQAPAPAAPAPEPPAFQPPLPPAPARPVLQPESKPANGEVSLNERLKVEKATLNERLAKPAGSSLAENQMEKKIESLKDSISINQRFSFINELFNGENLEYYQVIQKLDAFDNAEEARNFVTRDLSGRYNWSKKEEHVSKLLRLIERKFA